MIAILIIAHETLGKSLIDCAAHMLEEMPQQLYAISVKSEDEPDTILQEAQAIISQVEIDSGVLVFSDIFGGTPCNIAMKLTSDQRVRGISGLNLPMLVTALNYRHLPIEACFDKTIGNGQESILSFNEIGRVPYD